MEQGKLELGKVWTSQRARAVAGTLLDLMLGSHSAGNWGDISEEEWALNNQALQEGSRIFSAYDVPDGRVWVITEADRSRTEVLLPEDLEKEISVLLSDTPNAEDDHERENMASLSRRERFTAAVLIRAGKAATVKEAIRLNRGHEEAHAKALVRRRSFRVVE